ncbi:rhodanese-like domain-containing protein [Bacteriovorax sp. PP10]|uniref:Rhodanese-like domain-containing protein n=1 Tax=Bacteriovorax antarcticus TaxID=3088717 RepID=A0ABU5W212_9BACT|nr:rhodanese-like domain-containing protein [Bacteriovorax sp. PP10]MEA9357855.1 rhodanese-like domain-containing protein [Bacteriovorax sp. PP10]
MLLDNKQAIVIDVREPEETSFGIIQGALLLPMSVMNHNRALFEKEISAIPKDKTIVVYCASGRRAQLVGIEVEKLGHKVLSLGAFSSWVDAGLPVTTK